MVIAIEKSLLPVFTLMRAKAGTGCAYNDSLLGYEIIVVVYFLLYCGGQQMARS